MTRRTASLETVLWRRVGVALALLTALTGYALLRVGEAGFRDVATKKIILTCQSIVRRIGSTIASGNWAYLSIALTNDHANTPDLIYALASDTAGTVIAAHDEKLLGRATPTLLSADPPLAGAASSRGTLHSSFTAEEHRFSLYDGAPPSFALVEDASRVLPGETVTNVAWQVFYAGRPIGMLYLGFSRRDLLAQSQRLLIAVALASVALSCAALGVLHLGLRQPVRHLGRLAEEVGRFRGNSGQLDMELEGLDLSGIEDACQEVTALRDAFLRMRDLLATNWRHLRISTEEIRQASRTLQEYSHTLEQRVEERTRELTAKNEELEREIRQRLRAEAELRTLATTDPLTGLCNRRSMNEALETAIQNSRTRDDAQLSVLLLDIDFFKNVNDRFGHAVGDHALVFLATVLGIPRVPNQTVARYGGEEFLVLLPETSLSAAVVVAEALRHDIAAQSFHVGLATVSITVSIGVSCLGPGEERFDPMVGRADRALYQAKQRGRNRTEVELPSAMPPTAGIPLPIG